MGDLSERSRQDSAGAKLYGDELYDGLQCAGGKLPDHLPRSNRSASERAQQQRRPAAEHPGKHDVYIGVHHDAARLPNKLRALIAVSMIAWRPQVSLTSGLSPARR
jgi:hypothetical protein